ncbi:MAG: ABC transporter permease [Chloroflexi bacterium]|nr:MAG: ABC transporter permease [Chloroflexota bacterium]
MDEPVVKRPKRWRIIWSLTQKDWLNFLQHPTSWLSVFIPLFISLVVRFIFPTFADEAVLRIAVYAPNPSVLVQNLQQVEGVELLSVASETAVTNTILEDADGGFVLPVGWETAVSHQQAPPLTIYLSERADNEQRAALQNVLREQIWQLQAQPFPAELTWETLPATSETSPDMTIPQYFFVFLSLLSMSMVGLTLLPQMMVEEKETAALYPLLTSPASLTDYLIAKGLVGLMVSGGLLALLVLIYEGWQGDWGITAVSYLLGMHFFIGAGLLLGLRVVSRQRSQAIGGILILLLNTPGMFAILSPERFEKGPAKLISWIPTHYVVNLLASGATANGRSVWLSLLVVSICVVLLFAIVGWEARKRPYS